MLCPRVICLVSDDERHLRAIRGLLALSGLYADSKLIINTALYQNEEVWRITGESVFKTKDVEIGELHRLSDLICFLGSHVCPPQQLIDKWIDSATLLRTPLLPSAAIVEIRPDAVSCQRPGTPSSIVALEHTYPPCLSVQLSSYFRSISTQHISELHIGSLSSSNRSMSLQKSLLITLRSAASYRERLGRSWPLLSLEYLLGHWIDRRNPGSGNFSKIGRPHVDAEEEAEALTAPVPSHCVTNILSLFGQKSAAPGPGRNDINIAHAVGIILARHAATSRYWTSAGKYRSIPYESSFIYFHWQVRYSPVLNALQRQVDLDSRFVDHVRSSWQKSLGRLESAEGETTSDREYLAILRDDACLRNTLLQRDKDGYCASCVLTAWHVRLACLHGLCLECLRGSSGASDVPHLVNIPTCPICLLGPLAAAAISVVPSTATPRVLDLDGGGVKGIVLLETLAALEHEIGLDVQIHRFFDLIVGTSVGGICALGLGVLGWTVDRCSTEMVRMFTAALGGDGHRLDSSPTSSNKSGIWTLSLDRLRGMFKLLTKSAFHDSRSIKDALDQAFPPDEYILDRMISPVARPTAVVVDNISRGRCEIFASYNKTSDQEPGSYAWPDLENVASLTCTSALSAMATSAAPIYFDVMPLWNQLYQDGGVRFNNATPIAVREGRRLFGPVSGALLSISIGCGTFTTPSVSSNVFARLKDFALRHSEAEPNYRRYVSLGSHKDQFHRLNPNFDRTDVSLDDLGSLKCLRDVARVALVQDHNLILSIRHAARALIASMFYITVVSSEDSHGSSQEYMVFSRFTSAELLVLGTKYQDVSLHIGAQSYRGLHVLLPLRIEVSNVEALTSASIFLEHQHYEIYLPRASISISHKTPTLDRSCRKRKRAGSGSLTAEL